METSTTSARRPIDETAMAPLSIVIPVRDGAETLPGCLESLRAERGVETELIVVDDGSRDGTPEISRRYGCRLLQHPRSLGVAAARNAGARAARFEVVYFVDADIVHVPGTLTRLAQIMGTSDAQTIVCARVSTQSLERGWWPRYLNVRYHFLTARFAEGETVRRIGWLASEAAAMHRATFERAGGFREDLPGVGCEEHDFAWRLPESISICMHRDLVIQHRRKPLARFLLDVRFRRAARFVRIVPRGRRPANRGSASGGEVVDSALAGLTSLAVSGGVLGGALGGGWSLLSLAVVPLLVFGWRRRGLLAFAARHVGPGTFVLGVVVELLIGTVTSCGCAWGLLRRLGAGGRPC